MCRKWCLLPLLIAIVWPSFARSENPVKDIKKAVERSTLDQPGTKPFHLKASVVPSFERDKDSGRTAEIEIWWASPSQWKRDVRCAAFHQVEIVDGAKSWQKSEGDYFPQWLQETAVELVRPVPPLDEVLAQAKSAETRSIGPITNLDWTTPSGTPETPNILRSWVALQNNTGLLSYAGGLGWGAGFKDYRDFHGRMVARTLDVGTLQVTATVTTLEDLEVASPDLFDISKDGDAHPLKTILIDEISLRKNLAPTGPISWPPLQDGPLEGKVTGQIVVDREGRVRQDDSPFSENSAVNDAGRQVINAMRFTPFLVDGAPVQVMSQITVRFKTVRPAGREAFDSARNYFEHGRHLAFPAFGNGTAYSLRAEFEAKGHDGKVVEGQYRDIWLSETQWRRELSLGKSRYVRSRKGDKAYQWAEGDDAPLLQLVMKIMEPIPAIDTFYEGDWRIKRDTVNGVPTVRVLAGYESPEGKLDPKQARGFWFDNSGLLVKTYLEGLETQRTDFQDFAGVKVARRIDVLRDGQLGLRIRVTEVSPAGPQPEKIFEVKGHEWSRAFTAEVR